MSLTGTVMQGYLCALLIIKGSYRQFRFFTLCTVSSVASAIALVAVRNHNSFYFNVYWATEVILVLVTFFALQESFYLVFRNFLSLSWFKLLFPGIGLLMLAVSGIHVVLAPAKEAHPLASILISLEIGVGFLQFGIFFLFILLVRFFQLRWRQHALGVILGFGIAAAGTLIAYLLRSEFGTKFDPVVRIAPPIAYIMAVLVWLATFLRAEPLQPSTAPAITPEQMISELRRYTRVAKGVLGR